MIPSQTKKWLSVCVFKNAIAENTTAMTGNPMIRLTANFLRADRSGFQFVSANGFSINLIS